MGAGYEHLGPRQFRTLMQSAERAEQHASPLTTLPRLELAELLQVSLDHALERTRLPLTVHKNDREQFPTTTQLKRPLPIVLRAQQGMAAQP